MPDNPPKCRCSIKRHELRRLLRGLAGEELRAFADELVASGFAAFAGLVGGGVGEEGVDLDVDTPAQVEGLRSPCC